MNPSPFTLAHLSDLHVTPIRVRGVRDLANKRVLGWLSWRRHRRHEHRAEILEALLRDLAEQRPDHVAVTGDLTNVGLPGEIAEAAGWLERLGGPSRVSLVPGNHDAYAAPVGKRRFAPWEPYWADSREPGAERSHRFPYVRTMGPVALIGLSSAVPTRPGLATGSLGDEQLARLEPLLEKLGQEPCCRIVLIHHPPVAAGQTARRRLLDAQALRDVLGRQGADLVLHGHTHRTSFETVAGPKGRIPVVGVPSSSARGTKPERRARYHLYRVEPAAKGGGFRVRCSARVLGADGRFAKGPEHDLAEAPRS